MGEFSVDVFRYLHLLWAKRRFVMVIVVIFIALGVVFALTTPATYSATTVIVPQQSSRSQLSSSRVGSLANMAGISLDNMGTGDGGELMLLLYPQIFDNITLKRELLYSRFTINGADTLVSLYEYYTHPRYSKFNLGEAVKGWTVGLPNKIRRALRRDEEYRGGGVADGSGIITIGRKESELLNMLSEMVMIEVDSGNGYIKISATVAEPRLAAEVVGRVSDLMQRYITDFKLDKAAERLIFVNRQYLEAKREYDSLSNEWANYADANRAYSSELSRVKREQLQDNYIMAREQFRQLASQKLLAEMKVSEDTPIFSIIQPPFVPCEKSSPSKSKTVIVWSLLGLVTACAWVVLKDWFCRDVKKIWMNGVAE